jgi:hypothetical protein
VQGLRGRFPITFSPNASNLITAVNVQLVPKRSQIMEYYKDYVHDKFVREVPETHPLLDPLLTPEQQFRLGEDIYWDYLVQRLVTSQKLSLDLYSEIVWVNAGQILYMPPGYVHASGPHPVSYGYSIRSHMYLTPADIPEQRDGQGSIYDMRGDRILAPVVRYFPTSPTVRRINLYV